MINKNRLTSKGQSFRMIFVCFFIAVSSMLPLQANAFTTAPTVEILEIFDASVGEGEYIVTNNSGEDIYAFFVGNNQATQTDKGDNPLLNSWNSRVITRDVWESGSIPFPVDLFLRSHHSEDPDDIEPTFPLENAWTPPVTTILSWDNIFGAGFTQAVGYWSDGFREIPQTHIENGSTENGFLFSSPVPASPFIAFGNNGITGQGTTTVVPLPSAILLFGSGLLGFVGLKRKS